MHTRIGGSAFGQLRHMTASAAVELAFRRYLTQQQIPFLVNNPLPFTDPDRYDVVLGGRRCDIKSFLISYRSQIAALQANPGVALNAPALVPLDQYMAEGRAEDDLFLFAFVTGLIAASPADIHRAGSAELPLYLIHTMPNAWLRPRAWVPLGSLALKSESDEPLELEIGGQNRDREFVRHALALPPRTRCNVDADFHSLAYLHSKTQPTARLGIHSSSQRETYLIESDQWSNIWVYGLSIYLAGWITRGEFRQKAGLIHEGSRVFQYDKTRTKNLAVSISDLRPLSELLERVRDWSDPASKISS